MAERPRRAALQAEAAAETLKAFLQRRASASLPLLTDAELGSTGLDVIGPTTTPARPLIATSAMMPREGAPLRLPHTDWLLHDLMITGPADAVVAFQDAAAGSSTVPWTIDFDQAEEDWFHRLATARELSLAGARILARQLRDAAERRHALARSRVGRSRACPLDLHALVPVPTTILALGPEHSDSLVWLWERWGTTEPLRHVAVDVGGARQEGGRSELRYCFWSADWSPWRAITRVRQDWPALHLDLQPRYDAA